MERRIVSLTTEFAPIVLGRTIQYISLSFVPLGFAYTRGPMALCVLCPRCGATNVRPTVASKFGAYCRCQSCGYVWHDESPTDQRDNRRDGHAWLSPEHQLVQVVRGRTNGSRPNIVWGS